MKAARLLSFRRFSSWSYRLPTTNNHSGRHQRYVYTQILWSSTQQQTVREILSNEELVQKRLGVAKAKKEARQRSIEETAQRHLHIKNLIESEESSSSRKGQEFAVPALYAIKVSVCDELRKELRLSGREKRGRVFIELGSPATRSLKALKYDIHAFFRALRKSSFVLSATYPEIGPDGSIVEPGNVTNRMDVWNIETDEDVAKTFAMADDFFESSASKNSLKRPSIILHLTKDPNAPPPPPTPAYLENMADPLESPTMTMLSFYSFPPEGIQDPEDFAMSLRKKWKPFAALGRIYVAQEGVNAQMSVPTNVYVQCEPLFRTNRVVNFYCFCPYRFSHNCSVMVPNC